MAKLDRALRLECEMLCQVTQGDRSLVGAVVNTSSGGVRLEIAGGLPFEGLVGIALPKLGLRLDALVRWRRDDQAGLRLLQPGDAGAAYVSPTPSAAFTPVEVTPGSARTAALQAPAHHPAPRTRQWVCEKAIGQIAIQTNLQALGVVADACRTRESGQVLAALSVVSVSAEQWRCARSRIEAVIALARDPATPHEDPSVTLSLGEHKAAPVAIGGVAGARPDGSALASEPAE